jgi:hypothetical protein
MNWIPALARRYPIVAVTRWLAWLRSHCCFLTTLRRRSGLPVHSR